LIVGGFGVPHNPHFPTLVANGSPPAGEIERLYGEVRARLDEVRPDVLLFITGDHYNVFWEACVPVFSIGVAESAAGCSDYPELAPREVRIDHELARALHTHAIAAGFDVGMSQEFALDHTFIAPLELLRSDVPIVPLWVNALIGPLPGAARCHALGRALAGAPTDARVAVLASGSFSLEIGGPLISETSHTGVPDPAWMERVMELLRAGDVATLVAEASPEQLARAGNAGGELLEWITMLGALEPAAPAFLEGQPEFGHAYGAWPA
jgi:aromatic ring-opening dioxygenase catalytic subunit (LigB family)